MRSPSPINEPWAADGLEAVPACPLCGSERRALAYSDVQDWSFYSAPGKWTYWDCSNCQALYLDPRPTQASMGAAYRSYYTHGRAGRETLHSRIKSRLRNEALSLRLNASVEPRLHLPNALSGFAGMLARRVVVPFGWMNLAALPKGRFMDVGCGSGQVVALARQLGWNASGIELDPLAVSEARRSGLDIVEGSFAQLAHYEGQFDCVMCSHVLEHVHEPLACLAQLKSALKPGGVLLLTLPNSLSVVRRHFGRNWRGLEAPRHLCIPAQAFLERLLVAAGFQLLSLADCRSETVPESLRIQRRGLTLERQDIVKASRLGLKPADTAVDSDFIKLVCTVPTAASA